MQRKEIQVDSLRYQDFLRVLHESPFFGWGASPTLWAVISGEPTIVTPVMGVDALPTLSAIAEQFRANPEMQPPADITQLAIIAEGEVQDQAGTSVQGRELVAMSRDAEMLVLRQVEGNGAIHEVDPFTAESDVMAVMREVAAAAWPE